MPNMSIEVIAGIAFAVLIVLSLLMRRRRPKERTFKCSRCSTIAEHTPRTIDAWRSGKTKFFCNACHARWLRSHPAPAAHNRAELAPAHNRAGRSERSGCLGMFAFLVALPFLLIATWWGYA
ncbi:hypothetical protein [Thiobaca trueperi]|uniref:hypothetical protein n=1 Tax=Thiobaca trueperi TaxID=127458 RepID=UPI001052130F|nr:hypothetical protein [Thiobaca trueperi]